MFERRNTQGETRGFAGKLVYAGESPSGVLLQDVEGDEDQT